MHIIWMIRRRFPKQAGGLVTLLTVASAAAVVIGVGVLLLPK